MSTFNRVVVIVVALVILAGAVITLLVATGVVTPDAPLYGWFESQLQTVADATGGGLAAIIAISVVIALGMIALLLVEFMPAGKPASLVISSAEDGVTTIDVQSVCALAEYTATATRGVHRANCRVRESAGGLLISCRASLALGTNIVEIGADLRSKIKQVVEQLTGLPVAQVDIRAKYEPREAKRLAVR